MTTSARISARYSWPFASSSDEAVRVGSAAQPSTRHQDCPPNDSRSEAPVEGRTVLARVAAPAVGIDHAQPALTGLALGLAGGRVVRGRLPRIEQSAAMTAGAVLGGIAAHDQTLPAQAAVAVRKRAHAGRSARFPAAGG